LNQEPHNESQLLQLAMIIKKRVEYWVRPCLIELNEMPIVVNHNVLPLVVYNILIGIDSLYAHVDVTINPHQNFTYTRISESTEDLTIYHSMIPSCSDNVLQSV